MTGTKQKAINQKAFDAMLAHLRKQRKPSTWGRAYDNNCAYRGDGGLRCAVGGSDPQPRLQVGGAGA